MPGRLTMIVLSGFFFMLFASPSEAGKPRIWIPFGYSQYQVEGEIGILSSCAYRALKDGDSFRNDYDDIIRIEVRREKGGVIKIQMYVNRTINIAKLKADEVRDAFQEAINACYGSLSD